MRKLGGSSSSPPRWPCGAWPRRRAGGLARLPRRRATLEKVIAAYNTHRREAEGGIRCTAPSTPSPTRSRRRCREGPDVSSIYAQNRMGGWDGASNTIKFSGEPSSEDDALKKRFMPTTVEALAYGNLYGACRSTTRSSPSSTTRSCWPARRPPPSSPGAGQSLTNKAAGKFGLAWAYDDFYVASSSSTAMAARSSTGAQPTLDNAPANVKGMGPLQAWNKAHFMPAGAWWRSSTSLSTRGRRPWSSPAPRTREISRASTTGWRRCPPSARQAGGPCGPG